MAKIIRFGQGLLIHPYHTFFYPELAELVVTTITILVVKYHSSLVFLSFQNPYKFYNIYLWI